MAPAPIRMIIDNRILGTVNQWIKTNGCLQSVVKPFLQICKCIPNNSPLHRLPGSVVLTCTYLDRSALQSKEWPAPRKLRCVLNINAVVVALIVIVTCNRRFAIKLEHVVHPKLYDFICVRV